MTEQTQLQQNIHPKSFGVRVLQGAGTALVLVILFLVIFIGNAVPIGPWVFVPLGLVTFGGACWGIFYFIMDYPRYKGGWQKTVANTLCILSYVPVLYLSLVFSLSLIGFWH